MAVRNDDGLQEIQRLGMEKQDLILDGQQRMEQSLAIQQELDLLRAKLDKVRHII